MAAPLIAAAYVAKGIIDLASSYSESQALKLQAEGDRLRGKWQRQSLEFNATLSDLAATEALERGGREVGALEGETRKLRGEQQVQYAAQGIDINSGSAADVQRETDMLSEFDMITARSNAFKEAFGFKVQADDLRARGRMAEFEGENSAFLSRDKARSTILAGGVSLGTSILEGAGKLSQFGGYEKKVRR